MMTNIARTERRRMRNVLLAASVALAMRPLALDAQAAVSRAERMAADAKLPAWTRKVGARRQPTSRRVCSANASGAKGDSVINNTAAIQKAIDACSRAGGGRVQFSPGQ